MNLRYILLWSTTLLMLLLLGACQTQPKQVVYPAPEPVVEEEPPPLIDDTALRRARILADMLYEAKLAYQDNRLMTPPGNNAYDVYIEVLRIDPGNAVAREGLTEIVLRYVQLADAAIGITQYDNAASLLSRAARIEPGHQAISEARDRLARARRNKVESIALDPNGLRNRSLETMNTLAGIAERIRARETTFLINARTDEEGRWIYQVMREAVGGYRLRGNIGIAGTPSIVINE